MQIYLRWMGAFLLFMKLLIGSLILLLFTPTSAASAAEWTSYNNLHSSSESSASFVVLRNVSPECWMDAVNLVVVDLHNDHNNHRDTSRHTPTDASSLEPSLCSAMTLDQQKALALELARCHVSDLSRPLFVTAATDGDNHDNNNDPLGHDCNTPACYWTLDSASSSKTSTDTLYVCLSRLSDAGMQSYTHFFTYVHQICTRLTQEALLYHQEQSTVRLQQTSRATTRHLEAMLQQQHEWNVQQEERERHLDRQHSDVLWKLQRQGHLVEEQAAQIREQHDSMRDLQQQLLTSAGEREQAMSNQYQVWMEEQKEQQSKHEAEWSKHVREMLNLSRTVDETASKMKPLLGLDTIVSMATVGVTWFTSVFYFLGAMNAIWLLTSSKRHGWTRRYMFRLILLEVSLEFLMHWMVTEGLLMDHDRAEGIKSLRSWTFRLESGLYMLGWLLPLFFGSCRSPDTRDKTANSHGEMQRLRCLVEETMTKQEALQKERERRLVNLLQQQQQASGWQSPVVAVHQPHCPSNILPLPPGHSPMQSLQALPGSDMISSMQWPASPAHEPTTQAPPSVLAPRRHRTPIGEIIPPIELISGSCNHIVTPDEGWNLLEVADSDMNTALELDAALETHAMCHVSPLVCPEEPIPKKRSRDDREDDCKDDCSDSTKSADSDCSEPSLKKIKTA